MRNGIAESKGLYVLKAPSKTDPCDQFAAPQESHGHVQPALQQCRGLRFGGGGLVANCRVCHVLYVLALFLCFIGGVLSKRHGLNAVTLMSFSGGGDVERARSL